MRFLLLFFLLALTGSLNAQIIDVREFGAYPDSFTDATAGVKKAIEYCKKKSGATLFFPSGRYDFWPDNSEKREYFISNTSSETECPSKVKNIGLLFEEAENVSIDGDGSLFVFHGKMITLGLDRCKNIHVKNLKIDFERPTMSEIRFEEIYPDSIIASIHPDSKYAILNDKLFWYGDNWKLKESFSILTNPDDGTELYSLWSPLFESRVEEQDLFKVKFEGNFNNTNYKIGKTLTIRDPIRDHVGLFINLSKNVTLENVTIHYMHGLGIVSQFSEDLIYSGISIVPSRGRTISGFADGMHFSGCKGHIQVENCHFKGLHDDPMNIHGTYLRITEIHTPEILTVRYMHNQTYGFPAFFVNDTVHFTHSNSLQTRGSAIVKNVSRISDREVKVELSKPLPSSIGVGDCLENITWTPSLTVRNNRFEMTNTRGLLITTPRKVLVENNHFYRTGMYAIQIACDAGSWYESGKVSDVLIRNNIFEECGYNRPSDNYTIAVNPENHEFEKGAWVHQNIRIENNVFRLFDDMLLKAKSTNGIFFNNNVIEHTTWVSPVGNRYSDHEYNTVKLENCTNVKFKDNIWHMKEPLKIVCEKMNKKDIRAEKDSEITYR